MIEYTVKVYSSGDNEWYLNGKWHREDGPAIERANGDKYWFLDGKPHREDGPAIEYVDGGKEWYIKGKLHREDGPAVEWAGGGKSWYINGKGYTEQEYLAKTNPVKELTMEEIEKLLGYSVKVIK